MHPCLQGPASDYAIGANQGLGGALKWPVFKWSGGHDDAYFACLGKGIIKVFKTADMRMLEPIKMDGVHVSASAACFCARVALCLCLWRRAPVVDALCVCMCVCVCVCVCACML